MDFCVCFLPGLLLTLFLAFEHKAPFQKIYCFQSPLFTRWIFCQGRISLCVYDDSDDVRRASVSRSSENKAMKVIVYIGKSAK